MLKNQLDLRSFQRILLVLLLATLAVVMIVRLPIVGNRPFNGYENNEDAASHVAVTIRALGQTSFAEHKGLPLFTLGAPENLYINDLPTASLTTPNGYTYYTSWPPGLFFVPYIVKQALGMDSSPAFLRVFDLALQVLTFPLVGLLIFGICKRLEFDRERSLAAAMIGMTVFLAAPESLKSYVFSYWAQQLYLPIFLVQAILAVRPYKIQSAIAIVVLAFFGGLVCWDAYVVNIGIAIFLVVANRGHKASKWLALALVFATGLSLFALLSWFCTKVSLPELIAAMRYRANERSGQSSKARYMIQLMGGYKQSLGLFVIPLLVAVFFAGRQAVTKDPRFKIFLPFAILLLFPILENLLLLDHAVWYTYDRLKGILAATVAIAIFLSNPKRAMLSAVCVAACVLASVGKFWVTNKPFQNRNDWPGTTGLQLAKLIKSDLKMEQIPFTNCQVRGTELYYAERNIVELKQETTVDEMIVSARKFMGEHHHSQGVLYFLPTESDQLAVLSFGQTGPVTEVKKVTLQVKKS